MAEEKREWLPASEWNDAVEKITAAQTQADHMDCDSRPREEQREPVEATDLNAYPKGMVESVAAYFSQERFQTWLKRATKPLRYPPDRRQVKKEFTRKIIVILYVVLTICFEIIYFSVFRQTVAIWFGKGLQEALAIADERGGTVYLSRDIYHSQVLYYEKIPVKEFSESVTYYEYPAKYLTAESFTKYIYVYDFNQLDNEGTYIINHKYDISPLIENDYEIIDCDNFYVAYKNSQ